MNDCTLTVAYFTKSIFGCNRTIVGNNNGPFIYEVHLLCIRVDADFFIL